MSFAHLRSAAQTHTGRRRHRNEDAVLRLPEHGLFCVADGMGGAYGGEMASRTAVDTLRRHCPYAFQAPVCTALAGRVTTVRDVLDKANLLIQRRAEDVGIKGSGTTVVTIVFDPRQKRRAVVLHAGDSRAYRFRERRLERLTVDHSVASAVGLDSDEALPAMFRGMITRAIGLGDKARLDETPVDAAVGDLFLLCSDGLTRMLRDKAVAELLENWTRAGLDETAEGLVEAVNAAGGEDNISVVLIGFVACETPPTG